MCLAQVFISSGASMTAIGKASLALTAAMLGACGWLMPPMHAGTLLFQDDFSSPATGWDRFQDPRYSADYEEGSYRIRITEPNSDVWTTPGIELGDVIISVGVTKTAGPDDNGFGIVCRYRNSGNFYFLLVSSDGYSGIGQVLDGRRNLLTGNAMLPSAVGPLSGNVRLEARCVSSTLTLLANGIQVDQAVSEALTIGDVGLMAATYSQGGLEVLFDDFSVVQAGG